MRGPELMISEKTPTEPNTPNFPDPYSTPYDDPYHVQIKGESELTIRFANLEKLFAACADDNPSGGKKDLKVAIILPGTMQDFGKSMDAQYLYPVTNRMQTACEKIGLNLKIDAHISWECDDLTLGRKIDDPIVEEHHKVDLKKYFPDVPKTDNEDWVDVCRQRMVKRQEHLYKRSKEILSLCNLIVVGGPKVNQVMANLCHIFLLHFGCLGQLGMYLIPSAGTLPLKLRRTSQNNKWEEWFDRTWEDRNIGWVHMIRNPWAERSNPRFLIYIGGFYAQGTPAAMQKLTEIFDNFLSLQEEKRPASKYMLLQHHSDFKIGDGQDDYIPAHVVEAQVELPLNWFFGAKRPGLRASTPLWSITPPAFEGSIVGFKPILPKQPTDKE